MICELIDKVRLKVKNKTKEKSFWNSTIDPCPALCSTSETDQDKPVVAMQSARSKPTAEMAVIAIGEA